MLFDMVAFHGTLLLTVGHGPLGKEVGKEVSFVHEECNASRFASYAEVNWNTFLQIAVKAHEDTKKRDG